MIPALLHRCMGLHLPLNDINLIVGWEFYLGSQILHVLPCQPTFKVWHWRMHNLGDLG